jgi:hypothetical protein
MATLKNKTHKVEANVNFSAGAEFPYSSVRLFLPGHLPPACPQSPVNWVINDEGSDLFMGHDQHHPQWQIVIELFKYPLDRDKTYLEESEVAILNTFPH